MRRFEQGEISPEKYHVILLKYDNLIGDDMFEEIPLKYKVNAGELHTKKNRYVPLQINGTAGLLSTKRDSKTIEIGSCMKIDSLTSPFFHLTLYYRI